MCRVSRKVFLFFPNGRQKRARVQLVFCDDDDDVVVVVVVVVVVDDDDWMIFSIENTLSIKTSNNVPDPKKQREQNRTEQNRTEEKERKKDKKK